MMLELGIGLDWQTANGPYHIDFVASGNSIQTDWTVFVQPLLVKSVRISNQPICYECDFPFAILVERGY